MERTRVERNNKIFIYLQINNGIEAPIFFQTRCLMMEAGASTGFAQKPVPAQKRKPYRE